MYARGDMFLPVEEVKPWVLHVRYTVQSRSTPHGMYAASGGTSHTEETEMKQRAIMVNIGLMAW